MECRHLDGNPENNRVDNLCWGTRSENAQDSMKHGTFVNNNGSRSYAAKVSDKQIVQIRKLTEERKLTQREIGELFNLNQSEISRIKTKKRWK
jgi:predicted XRE-type DNA-binding protein